MKTVVLDEADVMLKLGFKEDVEKVFIDLLILNRYWKEFKVSAKAKCRYAYFQPQFQDGYLKLLTSS